MPGRTPFRRLAALVVSSVAFLALPACDDGSPTAAEPGPVDGVWTFTLAPAHGVNPDSALDFDGVQLAESDGIITGSYDYFRFEGIRRGADVEIGVYAPNGPDDYRHQTTMYLTLAGDSLVGGGTFVLPDIPTPLDTDGSIHPKYLADHEDAHIIHGEQEYAVRAIRTGDATTQSLLGGRTPGIGPASIAEDICSAVGSIMSFALGKVTGGAFRPMGGCWGRHDGGGYYMFGRYGPGSALPIWTQTVYKAEEWAWCTVRTYHFAVSIGDLLPEFEAANILIPAWVDANRVWLERAGIDPDNRSLWYSEARQLYDLTGGFAISVAFSDKTNNWSIYINTKKNISKTEVLASPLVSTVVNKYYAEHGESKVWVFVGNRIHDTFHLRRDPTGACANYVMFAYLFGTHEVEYD